MRSFNYNRGPLYDGGSPRSLSLPTHEFGVRLVETTQRFVYGTRYLTWDGRVFKYSNAVAACYSYHGAAATEAAALSWTVNAVETDVGDMRCTVPIGSRTLDDLAGAYLMIHDASATDTTWLFGIVGNDVSIDDTTIVYLDGAIPAALTTSDYFEVFENPYRELSEATNEYAAWMGVPANTADTAAEKFWLQTWGPAYISPGNTSLDDPAASERTVFWWNNGTLQEEASDVSTASQYAGYILNSGSSSIAGPLIMLMCST